MPIFQTATFEYAGVGSKQSFRYTRNNNNPNQQALGVKLALLESAESALVFSSGMAAISNTMLTLLKAGDHMLIQSAVYGITYDLVHQDFPSLGIEATKIDPQDPSGWKEKLRPTTKVIFVEAVSNPLIEVPDLPAVVAFAKQHSLVSVIDSTFATPINLQPLKLGFDLVVHSATKYLNGHSDVIAGVVAGTKEHISKITVKSNRFGGSLDPHAAFLLQRGLKTLKLRVQQQNKNALALAALLEESPLVSRVWYPGLKSHPMHALVNELFSGTTGVLSFELKGGADAADLLLKSLRLALVAVSLGGVETLVTRPAATTHAVISPAERAAVGITDGLVRVALGVEDTQDLLDDFTRALDSLGEHEGEGAPAKRAKHENGANGSAL